MDSVSAPTHLAAKIRAGRAALEGERKQVTVLFADMCGSLELAERSDLEGWRAIVDRFFGILCAGVHRFEGTVDKFTGDGIMAIFGAPIAHEDHARRACYAALRLQAELAAYAAELRRTHDLDLSMRIGLDSGEVVVGAIGEDLAMTYTAIGHTVGLAQRMEQLAEPGKAYLTQQTASLVEGYLALRDLGELRVKGSSHPLRVYELMGPGPARGALDVARARGLSRFVGREEELRTLESALGPALADRGQAIGIVGEAGVGKSRLCHELAERCRAQGTPVYHVAAQAHARSVPLMPVLQLMRSYFEIGEHDSEQAARERIAGKLVLLDRSFEDDLPLIFDFLAVPDPERPVERMDPEARRHRLLEVVRRLVRAQGTRQPGLAVFEDLQWLDAASEAFLTSYVEAIQGTRGLVVVSFRPGYRAPWMSRSHYRQLGLAPLGEEAVGELLAELLGSDPPLDGLPELVRKRTEGNPFFIEELVRSLVEAGSLEGERGAYRLAAAVEEITVPPSVHAVLAARIDRLGARDKAVLGAAAVVGMEFPGPLLERVIGLEAGALEAALRALVAGEFVHEDELYPEAVYAFKHPLTQEVAYRSQLSEHRGKVHAATAWALAERYPEQLDERAALVAHHWELAGEGLEAARWHARAAAWSGYNDPTEALRHWQKVIALTAALPGSAEKVALGLAARVAALQFGWRLGISDDQAETLFDEAERMASEAGDVGWRAMLLGGYGAVKGMGQGEIGEYSEFARRAIALAEESGDPALYIAMGTNAYAFFLTGEYREGMAILDRAIELAEGDPAAGAGMPVACPHAFCQVQKGFLLTNLGQLEEAGHVLERGRALAREHGDTETVGMGHLFSSYLAFAMGEPEAALNHAQRAVEITERIGGALSRAWAWSFLGVAEQMRREWRRAIDALERSQEIAKEGRTALEGRAFRLAHLAEVYLGMGDRERAHTLAADAVEVADAQGGPAAEIPAGLAWARVLLASAAPPQHEQVEAALGRVLELASGTTGMRTYEPFVHIELAELSRRLGDEDARARELREAHRLFAEIGATGHAERLAEELTTAAG